METLDSTTWDVLIIGTGLQQSLLALALSRSGKKILHIDENDYYGGAEAAFSLEEAEEWARRIGDASSTAVFAHASIHKPEPSDLDSSVPLLAPSRRYTLALSPEIIYARSDFMQHLITSQVAQQVEFLAVGSWWVYSPETGSDSTSADITGLRDFLKVPNRREDLLWNPSLTAQAKRNLVKVLRFILDYENEKETWEAHREQPFSVFLSEKFRTPIVLLAPLLALALSSKSLDDTTTEYALPRIARHLRSTGRFGDFSALITRFGGLSEISQVGCRASAVGGGVYVLGKGLSTSDELNTIVQVPVDELAHDSHAAEAESQPAQEKCLENDRTELVEESASAAYVKVQLKDGEAITTRWIVRERALGQATNSFAKSIAIVSSPLASLFPLINDETPRPACAVLVFPSGSLSLPGWSGNQSSIPPVHIYAHSSDSGECPTGQCILYATTSLSGESGFQLLGQATSVLLSAIIDAPSPTILWSLQYQQGTNFAVGPSSSGVNGRVLDFAPVFLDLAVDDTILDCVKDAWQKISGDNSADFLVFEDKASVDEDV